MENSYTLINNDTGEIVDEDFGFDTLEDRERKKKCAIKAKDFEEYKEIQSEYMGNFIFFLYNSLDKLKKVLSDADLCKYIMLATYIKKDGYLILDNNKTYINKKKMQELLLVAKVNFNKFYNNLIENNLLVEEEKSKKYKINLNIFWRGYEKDYKNLTNNKLENYTRLYIDATRELYKLNYKKSKKLAIAYKLIPYVNWKYNVLCPNIKEIDKSKINPLTIKDVMNILGYSQHHIATFKKDFYGIKFHDYVLFKTLQDDPDYTTSTIIVNPLFAYRNKEVKEIEGLFVIFNIRVKR
ncbi:hypothetical protein [Clostridium coskatii]|uniref:Uncharacterized protein n=1 Tax=Clostridium coskatii TaxID=1705578 RepID=A0A162J4F6_9CLOT|nr:hypothetical protein [Clostridium coskatii]OAA90145.1 hypothetical protein WX73_02109 [Clostridium coskatii]OBR91077.1 hypothetical protein CLCOS_36550 [Clostridium coskatii]